MMPRGAKVLHVGHQGDPETVCIWAQVRADEPTTMAKTFYVVGTGHDIPEPSRWEFIGTVNLHPIPLIWHIYTEAIR